MLIVQMAAAPFFPIFYFSERFLPFDPRRVDPGPTGAPASEDASVFWKVTRSSSGQMFYCSCV